MNKELTEAGSKYISLKESDEVAGEWRSIPGYSAHKVNRQGEILGTRGSKMTGAVRRNGYREVTVKKDDGTAVSKFLHRMVALAFLPNPKNKPFINHKNGIKTDNRVENLEWCTTSENNKHAVESGLMRGKYVNGERHGNSVLTAACVRSIRKLFKSGKTRGEIAKVFGVSRSNITYILLGKAWKHVK